MLAAALMHDDVIVRLGCLVDACREAVASAEDLAKRYMALRTDAVTLNRATRLSEALTELEGWATGLRLAYETLREKDS
jgi:hypothetical protein